MQNCAGYGLRMWGYAGCGVDGVKVDCQSTLDMIGSTLGGGSAYSAKFHTVLEDSVGQHFPGNALINCMCHSTNNLYRQAAAFHLQPDPSSPYSSVMAL